MILGSLQGLLCATVRKIIVFTWSVMFLCIKGNSVVVADSFQLSYVGSNAGQTNQQTLLLGKFKMKEHFKQHLTNIFVLQVN